MVKLKIHQNLRQRKMPYKRVKIKQENRINLEKIKIQNQKVPIKYNKPKILMLELNFIPMEKMLKKVKK